MTMPVRSLLLAWVLLPLAAAAQAPAEPLFNLVTLRAEASREVPNDLFSATLAAEAEGTDTARLGGEVNRAMQKALAAAKRYGSVKARSGSYQTLPIYDKGRVVRWRVRQELRLESTDIPAAVEAVGALQSDLVIAGMSLSVSPELRRQTENALLAEAIAAFEERARVVRDAMKAKAYRVRNLDFAGEGTGPMPMYLLSRATAAQPRMAPAVEPGTTPILVTVSGTLQLLQ
jgi:predicted secreted protein